jgi:hypothetical protein
MARMSNTKESALIEPLIIPSVVYSGLSPLEQLAAKALEKCGKVKIVEQLDGERG